MRLYAPSPARRRRRFIVPLAAAAPLALLGPATAQEPAQEVPGEVAVVALRAGHVHPVSGPAIHNGVIVIRGDRITAVGPAEEVSIPAGAREISFPDGHAYPGLVDALSTAFVDSSLMADASTNAGSPIHLGLHGYGDDDVDLPAAGVTTLYVCSRSNAAWRGLGAIVRPGADGDFGFLPQGEEAAVQLRMTAGPGNGHALTRQAALKAPGAAFAALQAYEKSFADHAEALTKYKDEFEKYLEYHRKKGGAGEPAPGGDGERGGAGQRRGGTERGGAGGEGRGQRGGGRGRRGGGAGGTPPGNRGQGGPPRQEPDKPAEGEKKEPEAAAKPEDKAPARPKYPKVPKRDPAKESLLKVRDGALPIRVEARRADEVLAALALATEHEIPRLILEDPSAAGDLAGELARRGVPVVLTDILPGSVAKGYGKVDPGGLPQRYAQAGAAVAIASGNAKKGRYLPLLAAYAAGRGLPESAALRAITLTPAEVLGIARHVGSLQAGKLADVLVTSGPLLKSDSRVLVVLSSGKPVYEAVQ